MYDKVMETVDYLSQRMKSKPEIAVILGSGLGDLVDYMEDRIVIDYREIPNFPVSTVEGHEGKLIFGNIGGVEVLAMKGRFHFYEGYSMKEVTYPIYAMKQLGIQKIIISNAAGGTNISFNPGTLMLIKDHINFFGTNPLIGKNDERFGPRFPDMTKVYSDSLRKLASETAEELGIEFREGVYLGTTGPSYETAAEIRSFINMGADAVGMSTVPEAITARYLGMDLLGISCITNMATGIAESAHSHESVVETAKKTGENFCRWVIEIIKKIGR